MITSRDIMNAMKIRYQYWIKTPGIAGRINAPEDFVVREIISPKFLRKYERTSKGMKQIEGHYSLFLLKKRGLTTLDAIKKISKSLKIAESKIGYAGLKDRFAVTYQYITIEGVQKPIKEKDLEISFIQKTNKFLSPGELIGNSFDITLHNCKNTENLEKIIKALKNRGMPNYFGMQRFGSNKNNHIIGSHLVKGKFDSALELINANYKHKYKKIEAVPKKLLKFLINSYQSWIFNETLNSYVAKNNKPSFSSVELKPFKVPGMKISCKGGTRKLFIDIKDISFSVEGNDIKLSFILPKGSYATVLIREICRGRE